MYKEEEMRAFAEDPDYHLQYRQVRAIILYIKVAKLTPYSCEMEHEFNFFFDNFINNSDQQLGMVDLLTGNMNQSLAKRPDLASFLIPNFGVGCRRITPGVGYLEALCESNVEAITKDITNITETGIVAADGTERPVDTIICATVSYRS